jgi:exosome complex component RRP4
MTESKLLVKEKDIVVPGEVLAEGMDYLPDNGTFREEEKIIASNIGIVAIKGKIIKLIILNGNYVPKAGDVVIGTITNASFSSWMVHVGYAYEANLSLKEATSDYINRGEDLTNYFDFGENIITKVTQVSRAKNIDLTMKGPGLRKLKGGRITQVTPLKVPRIIGREGSMVTTIKDLTNTRITIGQNGRIWIHGDNPMDELKAEEAIKFVDKNCHKEGLTDEVKKFLESKK